MDDFSLFVVFTVPRPNLKALKILLVPCIYQIAAVKLKVLQDVSIGLNFVIIYELLDEMTMKLYNLLDARPISPIT